MLIYLTFPIVVLETWLLYRFMVWRASMHPHARSFISMTNTSLMRLTFASQLVVELLTHNKVVGGMASFVIGIVAGFLALPEVHLGAISELIMNVFMGISMGIFLIGYLPLQITLVLICPVLLSSCMTAIHLASVTRKSK